MLNQSPQLRRVLLNLAFLAALWCEVTAFKAQQCHIKKWKRALFSTELDKKKKCDPLILILLKWMLRIQPLNILAIFQKMSPTIKKNPMQN